VSPSGEQVIVGPSSISDCGSRVGHHTTLIVWCDVNCRTGDFFYSDVLAAANGRCNGRLSLPLCSGASALKNRCISGTDYKWIPDDANVLQRNLRVKTGKSPNQTLTSESRMGLWSRVIG